MWELHEGSLVRFRCRTGHAYSAESVAAGMDEGVEQALWAALRALEEKAALARKLMGSPGARGVPIVTSMYGKRLREAEENARALRRMLGADKARAVTAAGQRSHRRAAGDPDEAAPE